MLLGRREFGLFALGLSAALQAKPSRSANALAFSIDVPIDHDRPEAGTVPLACEWGAPPKPDVRTIVLVADAQQFYLRPGGAARIQKELFGNGFNILAILGRSRIAALQRLILDGPRTDWKMAYRLLWSRQWLGDLEVVVEHLSLSGDKLGLYGRSGGAHLIHQFLARHPDIGARAYVECAVNHQLDVRWGFSPDRFWEEFSGWDPALARDLLSTLGGDPERRRELVFILQRQHFFEPLEKLADARASAVRAFLANDRTVLGEMRTRYQVDAIKAMTGTLEGIGGDVRVWEFALPHRDPRQQTSRLDPDIESLFYYAGPLADGAGPSPPPVPADPWERLRNYSGEVLQVAGRFDHTCDYRSQVGLAGMTRGSTFLLLDDNHVFERLNSSGSLPRLIQAFMAGGANSADFESAAGAIAPLRWREGMTS